MWWYQRSCRAHKKYENQDFWPHTYISLLLLLSLSYHCAEMSLDNREVTLSQQTGRDLYYMDTQVKDVESRSLWLDYLKLLGKSNKVISVTESQQSEIASLKSTVAEMSEAVAYVKSPPQSNQTNESITPTTLLEPSPEPMMEPSKPQIQQSESCQSATRLLSFFHILLNLLSMPH